MSNKKAIGSISILLFVFVLAAMLSTTSPSHYNYLPGSSNPQTTHISM